MYSVQIATSDGTLTRIELSIQYFAKDDINLYRNTDTSAMVLGTDWEWDGDYGINLLLGAEPVGTTITVRRTTDKDRAYNIYDGGAAFSRESLDENFRQMIYLAQEFTEGNGLDGLYRSLDMHGYRIINLGSGIDAGDAINKGQLDVVDARVAAMENTFFTSTTSYPWYTKVVTGTDVFTPGVEFTKASVYLNGVCQVPDYSYIVVDNSIMLAEAVVTGTLVFARLGEDTDSGGSFVTAEQFMAQVAAVDARFDTVALKGANTDITSLDGLTTPLSIAQGGTDANTASSARTNLGLGNASTRNVGTTVGTVMDGADSRIVGALQASNNLSDLTIASAARTNLGLGAVATLGLGVVAGTVLEGNAGGRLLGVQRFTANGTYTPSAGTTFCVAEVLGGGGAGGGTAATAVAQVSVGGGGSSGSYAKAYITAVSLGASQAITVGVGGTPVSAAAGGAGGASSIGTLVVCPGGNGGGTSGAVASVSGGTFVLPPARTTPTLSTTSLGSRQSINGGQGLATTTSSVGGAGGDSTYGSGGAHSVAAAGSAGSGFGGGGSGAASGASTAARLGGAGSTGLVVIYEYT